MKVEGNSQSLVIKLIDLCSSKDLVGIVAADGHLTVHRTLSWERVFKKKCSELCDDTPAGIAISPGGKHVAIAFTHGRLFLLDLENNTVLPAKACNQLLAGCTIACIHWVAHSAADQEALPLLSLKQPSSGDDGEALVSLQNAFTQLNGCILHCVLSDGRVIGFGYALLPVYLLPAHPNSRSSLHSPHTATALAQPSLTLHAHIIHQGYPSSTVCRISPTGTLLIQLLRMARTQLLLQALLKTIETALTQWSKKWKDNLKVLPMKLSLASGLMSASYEIALPVHELLLTVCTAGLWHPALVVIFAQHWNDQSILRLRSGIDSTSQGVLRYLRCRLLPRAHDLLALAQDQLRTLQAMAMHDDRCLPVLSAAWQATVVSCSQMLVAADSAIQQAQLARERLLLLMQLVKDCWAEASQQGGQVTGYKPDLTLRAQCCDLFASRSRPAADQAEYLSGSFLSLHLSTQTNTSAAPVNTHACVEEQENLMDLLKEVTDMSSLFPEGAVRCSDTPLLLPHVKSLCTEQEQLLSLNNQHLVHVYGTAQSIQWAPQVCVEAEAVYCSMLVAHPSTVGSLQIAAGSILCAYDVSNQLIVTALCGGALLISRMTLQVSGSRQDGNGNENIIPDSRLSVASCLLYEDKDNEHAATLLLLLGHSNGRFSVRLLLADCSFTSVSIHGDICRISAKQIESLPLEKRQVSSEDLFPLNLSGAVKMRFSAHRSMLVIYDEQHCLTVDVNGEEDEDEQESGEESNEEDEEES